MKIASSMNIHHLTGYLNDVFFHKSLICSTLSRQIPFMLALVSEWLMEPFVPRDHSSGTTGYLPPLVVLGHAAHTPTQCNIYINNNWIN